MIDDAAVKKIIYEVSKDAPFPHPDNPNCIRVAIAYALGMAQMVLPLKDTFYFAALEYLATASDEEILAIPNQQHWKNN